MATAEQVINSALRRIIVQGSEAPLEPDEYQDAIFTMNAYMADLDAQGVALGYTIVTSTSDPVTIPLGALRGLITNLAVELAPDYGGIVSPELIEQARTGLSTMRLIGQSIPVSYYPSTLPYGSGNNNFQFGLTSFFYPNEEAEILGETTGSIGLETDTE